MLRFSTTKTPWTAFSRCGTSNGLARVLGRHRTVAPGVAAGERDAVLDEPVGHGVARAGLAFEVYVGVRPVGAPARVEEDGVARLGIDAGQMRRR